MSTTIVLHNLPVGCMESDIHRALLIYGTAVSIDMDTRTSQAVVTMRTKQEAQALLNRHAVNVSGTSVRVDTQQQQQQQQPMSAPQTLAYPYSNAPGTAYAPMPPGVAAGPPHAPYYPPTSSGGYSASTPPTASHYPPHPAAGASNGGGYSSGNPASGGGGGNAIMPAPPQSSRRLKVIVEDCRYPINRDVLVRMFSMIAPPVVVTCGPYGPTTTGMVEFAEAAAAQQAVDQFHGKAIYPDCCYVKLLFEPMWEVPGPGYAEIGIPPNPATAASTPPAMGASHLSPYPYGGAVPGTSVGPYAAPTTSAEDHARYGGVGGRDASAYYGVTSGAPPPAPGGAAGPYSAPGAGSADGRRDGGYPTGSDDGRREYVTSAVRGRGRGGEGPVGLMVRGGRGAGHGVGRGLGAAGFSPYDAPTTGRGAAADGAGFASASESYVLVANVAERVPLYDLWVLLEVYGNVRSLKRQHSDRTHVVAHFQHAADTTLAVQYLNGCLFRGMRLRLKRFFGYRERVGVEWDLGSSTDPATMACLFETKYHHRVSPHIPRNPRSAMYPDCNVFISNLTSEVTEDEIADMWRDLGLEPTASFRRGPKALIVGFRDIEAAVDAVIAIHLRDCHGRALYATFSRYPPEPRPVRAGEKGDEDNDHAQDSDEGEREAEHEAAERKEETRSR